MSLVRHYQMSWTRALSLVIEYADGTLSFTRWLPRILIRFGPRRYGHRDDQVAKTLRRDEIVLGQLPGFYINLDKRRDRRLLVEEGLAAHGLNRFERLPGIPNSLGILGCTQSHIAVLEKIQEAKYSLAMICEDDVEFLGDSHDIRSAIQEFSDNPGLDVLCLAYRLRAPRLRISKKLAIGNGVQTASCYVVKQSAIPILLDSFRESEKMLASGVPPRIAANDMHWKKAQSKYLTFAITRTRLARQRPSFSDVVGRYKDYRA